MKKRKMIALLLAAAMISQNNMVMVFASNDGTISGQYALEQEAEEKSESGDHKIPDGAGYYNGHYYYVYDSADGWNDAEAYCESMGGYLATITSPEENDYVFQYMKDSGHTSAYFGFTDQDSEGIWKWVTGESVSYTNWAGGEPSNDGNMENYAMFYYKFSTGKWNDGDFGINTQGRSREFICEWGEYDANEDNKVIFNGNAYQAFHIGNYTWEQAKNYCEELGGHLATITSQEEEEFIEGLLSESREFYWIGGEKDSSGGEWNWVTDESFNYENWDPKQPDSDGAEYYLGITAIDTDYAGKHKWNDFKYDGGSSSTLSDSGFICEWDDYAICENLQFDIPKDKYAVIIRNKSGKGIVGAELQCGLETYTSGENGITLMPLEQYGSSKKMTVVADGYVSRTLTLTQNLRTRQSMVVLNDNKRQVNYASLEYKTICRDVLSEEYRLDVGDETTGYKLKVELGDDSIQVSEYTLVLNASNRKLISAKGNVFEFKGSDLQGWLGTLAICAYQSDGTLISKTPLALKTYKGSGTSNTPIEISGGKITIQVDKDAPFMANQKITFDLFSLPVEFNVSDSKLRIGLNLDASTLKEDGKWRNFKEVLRTYADDKLQKNIDKYIKKKEVKSSNPEISVLGYGECDLGASKAAINVAVKVSWKFSSGEQQVSFFVFKVTGKIGGSASTEFGIQWEDKKVKPYFNALTVKPSGSVEASAGVGAANVVSGGVYGNATTEATFNLWSSTLPLFSEWKVKGEIGVYGRALWKEIKIPFWTGETYLYRKDKKKAKGVKQKKMAVEKLQDTSLYQDISRSYLKKTSVWNTGRRMRALSEEGLLELQNHIYQDVRPLLVNTSDGLMMLYITDGGTERASRDRTMLVYSLYDSVNRRWSEPKAVDDDKMADFSPSVWSDGEKAYVVWQNAQSTILETDSMEEAAVRFALCTGVYEDGSWSINMVEPTEDNGFFERMPQIYGEDGKLHVAWVQSESDPLFGNGEENIICEYCFNQNGWEKEKESRVNGAVLSLEIGKWNDNKNCILYTEDTDKELSTKEDVRLEILQPGNSDDFYVRKSGVQQASFIEIENKGGVLCYQDGKLYFQEGQDMPQDEPDMGEAITPDDISIPEQYRIIPSENGVQGIVWSLSSENQANLYGMFLDEENQWNMPVVLEKAGKNEYLENVCIQKNDGEEILVCTKRHLEWQDILEGGDGKEVNSLCYMNIQRIPDLEVKDAELDQSDMVPGAVRSMDITVANHGTEEASDFRLTVIDQEGNVYYDQNVGQKILAGSEKVITIQIPLWKETEQRELTVNLSCDTEKNTENNAYALLAGQANLDVYAGKYLTNGRYTLGITVTNTGFSPASGTVYIADYETGKIYKSMVTRELAYQQSDVFLVGMDELGLDANENAELYIYTDSEAEQIYGKNEDYTMLHAEEKRPISEEDVTITLSQDIYTYDGTEKKPEVVVNGLREGIDYRVSYVNNVNAGTAAAVVTGINEYCGSLSQDFTIKRLNETITGTTQYFKHLGSEPFLLDAVTDGDGKLTYSSSNDSVVTINEEGEATIKGVGTAVIAVTGEETLNCISSELYVSVEVSEKAPDKDISSCNIRLEETSYVYDKKEKKPLVTVSDGDSLLKEGVHYAITYANNVKAGNAKVVVTAIAGSGYTGFTEKTFTIQKAVRNIILDAEAEKGYTKKVGDSYFYLSAKISPYYTPTWTSSNPGVAKITKVGILTRVYIKGAGAAILTVSVPETENYLSCSRNIKITVTGRQNTVTSGKPKKTKIVSARKKGTKMTVKWRKVKGIHGYQLQYFAGARGKKRTVTIYKAKTTKKVIKRLKASKKYYVRIRTFKGFGTERRYSAWSKKKKVK